VRQRSIALITFNWSRLTWPRLASRQAGPWSRRMSAYKVSTSDPIAILLLEALQEAYPCAR
jgi:hypothetical protein